jgi:DNA-binding response OmpR family regulator
MRVLYIDDDKDLLRNTKEWLTREGFAVDTTFDSKEGLSLAKENSYDIILLDVGLPEIGGIDILKKIRQDGQSAGIFMISGQTDKEIKVQSLEAGADDYMTKPFYLEELVVRMRLWLKRRDHFLSDGASPKQLCLGNIKMDSSRREVTIGGRPVYLTPKEFMVLEYMLHNAGRIVTQNALAQAVWNIDYECGNNVVESHMNRLRKKIDEPGKPSIIQTVRGSGYMIEKDSSN